jgi:hypothetical protein
MSDISQIKKIKIFNYFLLTDIFTAKSYIKQESCLKDAIKKASENKTKFGNTTLPDDWRNTVDCMVEQDLSTLTLYGYHESELEKFSKEISDELFET